MASIFQITPSSENLSSERFKVYTQRNLHKLPHISSLSKQQQFEIQVVANVLPFRVNQYVAENLIDWSKVPDDPMFRLVFPQREMLEENDYGIMSEALKKGKSGESNTFVEFKRLMGTDKKSHSAFMEADYLSEDLSAEVLKKLKSFTQEDSFKSVVITFLLRNYYILLWFVMFLLSFCFVLLCYV